MCGGGGAPGKGEGGCQTIFLMLGRLKLPVLRCFWTWLAEPWRVRPPVDSAELGDSCTFSLSTPGGEGQVKAGGGGSLTDRPHPRGIGHAPSYLGSAGRWPVRSWSWTGSGWQ